MDQLLALARPYIGQHPACRAGSACSRHCRPRVGGARGADDDGFVEGEGDGGDEQTGEDHRREHLMRRHPRRLHRHDFAILVERGERDQSCRATPRRAGSATPAWARAGQHSATVRVRHCPERQGSCPIRRADRAPSAPARAAISTARLRVTNSRAMYVERQPARGEELLMDSSCRARHAAVDGAGTSLPISLPILAATPLRARRSAAPGAMRDDMIHPSDQRDEEARTAATRASSGTSRPCAPALSAYWLILC